MSATPLSGPDLPPFALPADLPFTSLDRAFARFLANAESRPKAALDELRW